MAPLRSSRHTRHTDAHAASTRAGRNANDFDPTDGLPVRKFVLETVSVNQDAAAEATDPHASQKASKDAFPWPELQLPPFFDQLPLHNQEILRRARAGTRETKLSVWDKKNAEWVRHDEARKRGLLGDLGLRKSRYLAATTNEDGEEIGDAEDDDDDEPSDDDEMGDVNGVDANGGDSLAINGVKRGKKRKQPPAQLLQDRTFEVKKWVQVPMDKADKMPEPKYLADRRAGMPNFYNQSATGAWANAQGYGAALEGGSGANYDLGDGSGLGTALGGGAGPGPNAGGVDTPPVRKNMPPRPRKKKGGPGRKKKEVVEAERRAAEEARRKAEALARGEVEEVKPEGEGDAAAPDNSKVEDGSATPHSRKDDDDESEGEGSEEGEVNEASGDRSADATPTPTPGTPGGAGSTTTNALSGMPNAPTVPSSLSREVGGAFNEDTPVATDSAEALPPALEAQIADESSLTAPIAPPSAEPAVPETLIIDQEPVNTAPPRHDVDEAPIASPLSEAADDTHLPQETSPTEGQSPRKSDRVTVPFDVSAEEESAPLLQGVEISTAEQLDTKMADAVATPPSGEDGAGMGKDVREAVAQGERAALVQDQLPDTGTSGETKEDSSGGLDLLGGLEQAVASQQEAKENDAID